MSVVSEYYTQRKKANLNEWMTHKTSHRLLSNWGQEVDLIYLDNHSYLCTSTWGIFHSKSTEEQCSVAIM